MRLPSNNRSQRILGVALICVGFIAAGVWFLWLVPKVSRHDPMWGERFSQKAHWAMVQKYIHRYGWDHDDFYPVGNYGDKTWAAWIMSKAQAGEELSSCGSVGHKDVALKFITCHDPALGTNSNTEAQWILWWSTNKEKSQLEWIQSGLRLHGAEVHLPPIETDTEPLLALLGNKNTNVTEKTPGFAKYNAFRWLRDSGFDVIAFVASNITVQTPPVIRVGAIEYGKLSERFPKRDEVGVLEFKQSTVDTDPGYTIAFYEPKFQIAGYAAMLVPLISGITLLVYSKRNRGNELPQREISKGR